MKGYHRGILTGGNLCEGDGCVLARRPLLPRQGARFLPLVWQGSVEWGARELYILKHCSRSKAFAGSGVKEPRSSWIGLNGACFKSY